jgi:argininosuccinate synthase
MEPVVVLAYSGGLDTSAIVPWLREVHGARVICYVADVGQGPGELRGVEAKAMLSGAAGCVVEDLREEFVTGFVLPTVRAGAVYARTYLLGTAMARPLIAARQVAAARAHGAEALAHGCTGKGNDQVRFELTFQALAPDLRVIAPWREWEFRGREDLVAYLQRHGVPAPGGVQAPPYSRDRNLWHCSHEGGILEDPGAEPPSDLFLLTADPVRAPARPDNVLLEFDEGVPVAVDGTPLGPLPLLERLNEIAGAHGVGRADVVEDRLVGMKSRGIYETPGGTVLREAHRALEQLVLDRRLLALKDDLASRYADLVYEGRWWTTEREALDALVDVTQRAVTGTVRVRLFKGTAAVVSRTSPHSLYSDRYATFGADEIYDHADAAGFIRLFGLPVRIAAEAGRQGEAREPALSRNGSGDGR